MHDCGHDGCDGPYTDHHTFTDGKRHCSCICDGCGNPEVQLCYENYRGDLLCCECAGCFEKATSAGLCSRFWNDLTEDMNDPEFRKHYEQAMRKLKKERDAPRILATGKRLWRRINQWPFRWR